MNIVAQIESGFEDRLDKWFLAVFREPLSAPLMQKLHPDDVIELCRTIALWAAAIAIINVNADHCSLCNSPEVAERKAQEQYADVKRPADKVVMGM